MGTKKSAKKAVKKVQRALDSDEAKGIVDVVNKDLKSFENPSNAEKILEKSLKEELNTQRTKEVSSPKKYTNDQIRERIRKRFFPRIDKERLTEDQKIAIEHELKIRLK